MSVLDKFMEDTDPNDTRSMLSKAVMYLAKSLGSEKDESKEEEKEEHKKDEADADGKMSKAKKDTDKVVDEPKDGEDESAQKKNGKKVGDEKKIDEIKDDQEDVYFDDDDDNDLPDKKMKLGDEAGKEEGIITNQGRRVKKSQNESGGLDPDLIETMSDTALLLDASLQENAALKKSMADMKSSTEELLKSVAGMSDEFKSVMTVMLKSQVAITDGMELIKSSPGPSPMSGVFGNFGNSFKTPSENDKQYSPEQVREALHKSMIENKCDPELPPKFDAYMGRQGASATDWVNTVLNEAERKSYGL